MRNALHTNINCDPEAALRLYDELPFHDEVAYPSPSLYRGVGVASGITAVIVAIVVIFSMAVL